MKALLLASLLISFGTVNAATIDFETGLDPAFNYTGVSILNAPISPNSGYDAAADFTRSSHVAFNPWAKNQSTFSWANIGTFDLNSFVIAGAWGSQTLTIDALLNNSIIHSAQFAIDTYAQVFAPNWQGIDTFTISTGHDYRHASNVRGGGKHWALDNITINENLGSGGASVPEPTAVALLGLGIIGISLSKKKRVTS